MIHRKIPILMVALFFVTCSCQTSNITEDSTAVVDSLWQNGTASDKATQTLVIDIETLKPPKELLKEMPYAKVLKSVLEDLGAEDMQIVANNKENRKLVTIPHPFFDGMHRAYADHRPFVLTPDAVWLLICQGFSNHVNNNAEKLRHYFVDFEGKQDLKVYANDISLDNPNSPWEKYFPKFTSQIASYVGDSLVSFLTSDFSTSTPTTRTASQITVMASMQKYFDYSMISICGIPKVILEGTPEDWQRIINGVQYLRQYELAWWVDQMLPVLKKIKLASEGEVDKAFWRNMYKQHKERNEFQGCGSPDTLVISDGWVLKFYPYYDDKVRSDFKSFSGGSDIFPPEIAHTSLNLITITGTTPLQLNAGFVGLSQDPETFALKPEIGWFITLQE